MLTRIIFPDFIFILEIRSMSAGINTTSSHGRSLTLAQAVQPPPSLDFQVMRQNVNESQRQGINSP